MTGIASRPLTRRGVTLLAVALAAGVAPATASPSPSHDPSGGITGVVTGPDAAPAPQVCVDAWTEAGWGGSTVTDDLGRFAIDELVAGDYVVAFSDCASIRRFPDEYYLDAVRLEDATLVPVHAREVSKISAQLDAGGSITGRLRDDVGEVAPFVCVQAQAIELGSTSWTSSGPDGTYAIHGLRAGDHLVSFGACDERIAVPEPVPVKPRPVATPASPVPPEPHGWPYGYHVEYWNEAATADGATPVTVVENASVDGIDASLQRASGLEIRVLDADGEPASAVCATAHTLSGEVIRGGYGDGWIRIGRLHPGEVALLLEDCGSGWYRSEWYDDARTLSEASPITIPPLDAATVTVTLDDAPMPDLAVTGLRVTPVKIRTDVATVPGAGTQRDIRLEIGNRGSLDADTVGIVLEARTITDGARKLLLLDVTRLEAGARTVRTVRANFAGMVGDVQVRATTCTWTERNLDDNVATADSYAIVGGTGVGVTPSALVPGPFRGGGDPLAECESLLWWEEPLPQA